LDRDVRDGGGCPYQAHHSDVKHGFVISFKDRPEVDLAELEAKAKGIIQQNVIIQQAGEDGITVGEHALPCTGTRTHVKRSGEIENFRLVRELAYHPISKEHMLIGIVDSQQAAGYEDLTKTIEA